MNPRFYSQNAKVCLIPVIEMLPTDYALVDRPVPFDASPDEYFRYWSACLADSKIEGLHPIRFWHVPIEQFNSVHIMERVIHAHRFCDDSDNPADSLDRFSDPEEYLSAFMGGYVLSINDRVICTPRCCADLTDIQNWQEAADYRSTEWSEVWIGHPWINVYFDGTQLVFTDQNEGDSRTEWTGEITIAPEALQQAIDQAKQGLQEFYLRLLPIVESMVAPSQAVQITERLTAYNQIRLSPSP